nr:MAG TPA: hypothetical protein [Caudoviricetes sp.]
MTFVNPVFGSITLDLGTERTVMRDINFFTIYIFIAVSNCYFALGARTICCFFFKHLHLVSCRANIKFSIEKLRNQQGKGE